ncbi:uncharacterized protein [Dendropsophus ebraccatus]|uniref:uncharacterized protein n=1 Tax=Dendropsophus ebraccatus TaxID=150705 RepID=UPI0038315529
MKSKCGAGVLLLAALLSAIAVWFLPVSSAAADILLLLTGGSVTRTSAQTKADEIRTFRNLPTLTSEANSTHLSDSVTDLGENVTFSVTQTPYPVTADNTFITKSPEITGSIADITSDVQTDTRTIAGTEGNNRTDFYPSLHPGDQRSVTPDISTGTMEMDKAECNPGPTSGEVLAIAVGAVFLTVLLSALLYQFAVFMRNRKAPRDPSVYIIENELHKYDVEANGLEPETKL